MNIQTCLVVPSTSPLPQKKKEFIIKLVFADLFARPFDISIQGERERDGEGEREKGEEEGREEVRE